VLPQADFAAAPQSGLPPLSVSFTNASTGDYTTSLWRFGDGVTSTLESPTHVYTAAGVYTVSLRINGAMGEDTTATPSCVTVNEPLYIHFPLVARGH